ncbi:MAG: sugar phosphate isomerase/epimerase [Planctomycetota bacterium]|nr:sugar phosphate isomerase/epimerase [Planctomycetaceae bacterium]MDQ3329858.1 sugar phosphate isomerase/epimerase [Planctomycetota bacterium]
MPHRPRIGFPTRLLEGALHDKIAKVAAFGANGAQLDLRYELPPGHLSETGRRQFRNLFNEHGLAIAPALFPLRRALADSVGIEERIAALTAALRFAAELKVPGLIIRPGSIPPAETPERTLMIELLNDLARAGDHVGVTLTVTTGREPSATFLEVVSAVTAGPIGINFDPAAAVMSERDPAAEIRTSHAFLKHLRVRDGLRDTDGAGVEVEVGRGEVDWDEVIAALAEADFAGWMTPDRTSGEDPATDAARAVSYIRNVMPF